MSYIVCMYIYIL